MVEPLIELCFDDDNANTRTHQVDSNFLAQIISPLSRLQFIEILPQSHPLARAFSRSRRRAHPETTPAVINGYIDEWLSLRFSAFAFGGNTTPTRTDCLVTTAGFDSSRTIFVLPLALPVPLSRTAPGNVVHAGLEVMNDVLTSIVDAPWYNASTAVGSQGPLEQFLPSAITQEDDDSETDEEDDSSHLLARGAMDGNLSAGEQWRRLLILSASSCLRSNFKCLN